ncbi:unnamed protein product [Mytilus coruscus]|uniref:Uncharacterized protein n=1 Tax=Mytilus coruscus TaxID=42192 RepID=A0A6J8EB52_MYTCO|nr:unnamed protein product [Mytilus coruscus]
MSMESMSKPVPQQTAETKASNEILDMHKASDKDCYIPERKYRYSRLHKSSVTDSYIPKSKSDKVSKIVHERYCTTRKQKSNIRKQTEREQSDSYLKPDQFHTMPQNIKKTLIINETRDEKKEEREILSTQSMSKSEPQQTADTTASNEMYKSAPQQTAEITTFNKMSKTAPQQTAETTASNKLSKSAPQQYAETTVSNENFNLSSELTLKRYCSTREHTRNIRKQTEREKSDSYPELDQYHTMLDIEVADKYPNEDIFHKLDDIKMIGFYQVQEKNLIPIIENMGDNKMIELYETLYDQHIEVTQSIGNTVDDTQSSSLGSSINDFQDAEENDGTLKTTIKTFVKKNIPDCLTNSNQCQPTETLSSNWQNLNILSGTDINTQYIPMPPNTPKPKTSNSRRNRYHRKNDENNNSPEI